jgi:hypothetical protein
VLGLRSGQRVPRHGDDLLGVGELDGRVVGGDGPHVTDGTFNRGQGIAGAKPADDDVADRPIYGPGIATAVPVIGGELGLPQDCPVVIAADSRRDY